MVCAEAEVVEAVLPTQSVTEAKTEHLTFDFFLWSVASVPIASTRDQNART